MSMSMISQHCYTSTSRTSCPIKRQKYYSSHDQQFTRQRRTAFEYSQLPPPPPSFLLLLLGLVFRSGFGSPSTDQNMSQWIVVDDSDSAIIYTADPATPWRAVNQSIPGIIDLDNAIFETGHVLSSNGSLSFSFTGTFTCC